MAEINNYIKQGFLSVKDYLEAKKFGYSDDEIIKSIDDTLRAKRKTDKEPLTNY